MALPNSGLDMRLDHADQERLMRKLHTMGSPRLQRRISLLALRAAGKPVKRQAAANSPPHVSGELRPHRKKPLPRSWIIKRVKPRGTEVAAVKVASSEFIALFIERGYYPRGPGDRLGGSRRAGDAARAGRSGPYNFVPGNHMLKSAMAMKRSAARQEYQREYRKQLHATPGLFIKTGIAV